MTPRERWRLAGGRFDASGEYDYRPFPLWTLLALVLGAVCAVGLMVFAVRWLLR